jgi:hypothetical protein
MTHPHEGRRINGCGCEYCNATRRAYQKEWRKRPLPENFDKHGTHYGYTRGCRCAGCTAAASAYQKAYYARKRNAK